MSAVKTKSTVAAYLFVAMVTIPFAVSAETIVYSGKGASAYMSGNNGGLYINGYAFESMQKSKSEKNNAAGISLSGQMYTANACWYGYGGADDVEFKATGNIPKHVVASGAVEMTWTDWCGSHPSFTETLQFSMDLSAMTDQTYSGKSLSQNNYGDVKVINHYNYSSAPAEVGAGSYFSSPAFGSVTGSYGEVGQSKEHQVEILHDN